MLPCDVYSLSIVPTPAAGNSISHINSTGGTVTLTTATKQTATVRSTAASGYKDYSITIICGFPTSIVYQTVNVMMSVNDNPNVNGGFTFEKPYQWTKNGHPISGATLWYLYLGDGLKPYLTDDMYNVEMTTNGQTYTLCSGVKFIKLVDN
ncbi:hypothetical protein FACS1894199_15020 [Bacteroidia bacterium]|nr:hypothetical protein FACS1894199_15020 [Bacteroidia bacterium]